MANEMHQAPAARRKPHGAGPALRLCAGASCRPDVCGWQGCAADALGAAPGPIAPAAAPDVHRRHRAALGHWGRWALRPFRTPQLRWPRRSSERPRDVPAWCGRADEHTGPRVAIYAPPGPHYVEATWGAWLAGGIAVPLCLTHPPKRACGASPAAHLARAPSALDACLPLPPAPPLATGCSAGAWRAQGVPCRQE